MKVLLAAVMVVALLVGTPSAQACDPQISRVAAPRNDAYEPFSPDATIYPLEVTISNRADQACELKALAIGGSSGNRKMTGSASGAPLVYEILGAHGVRLPNEQDSGFGVPVALGPNAETILRLQVRVPAGQVVPSGHYDENIQLRLVGQTGGVRADRRLPLSVQVQSRAQVNLAGTASVFNAGVRSAVLSLGELTDGSTNQIFIQLRANEPVRVRLDSRNRGMLAHVGMKSEVIPYTLVVDGTPANLAGPFFLTRSPRRTLEGASYRAVATVPKVGNKFAGEYRDLIVISVDAI